MAVATIPTVTLVDPDDTNPQPPEQGHSSTAAADPAEEKSKEKQGKAFFSKSGNHPIGKGIKKQNKKGKEIQWPYLISDEVFGLLSQENSWWLLKIVHGKPRKSHGFCW
ncbi:hypothetical protein COCNU_07G008080 [Cocos nucifera]|uniref:Uncharacterized protein n=1 Tax=Cocos nucifera TaxID=13894 RepID=A0A8K0N508_COCNU|nr:hypothetical protein COCNU_07G008080 [Cocos nucifera]